MVSNDNKMCGDLSRKTHFRRSQHRHEFERRAFLSSFRRSDPRNRLLLHLIHPKALPPRGRPNSPNSNRKTKVRSHGSPTGRVPPSSANFDQKSGGGVFIAYATDAGADADDGNGKHSPFTQALLRNIQKPISIDDMFSLVTKEVRLVTRNAQRPYKYASLESIVCVAPNCSNSATAIKADVFRQAAESEADELQIALQTNNSEALDTFLQKYPHSPKRSEILSMIGTLRNHDEVLFDAARATSAFELHPVPKTPS